MNHPTVSQYLGEDHRRLDGIACEVGEQLRFRAFPKASLRFAEFVSGLSRHIDVEERVLFPAFEEITGEVRGPTAVMRAEHAEIRRAMDAVSAALRDEDALRASEGLGVLVETLASHNAKEERIVYPMTDEALGSSAARAALVDEMRTL